MSLTATDLDQITSIVKSSIKDLPTRADIKVFATKVDLSRMESRLTTAINLLQRDSFSRLDQHEARITRLENAH